MENMKYSLELEDDIGLHKKGWLIQAIGWSIFFIILLLAVAGLFGTGPLSYTTISQNSDQIEYERFLRFESESEMVIRLNGLSDTVHIKVPTAYDDYIDIVRITPLPFKNEIIAGNTVYSFLARKNATVHVTIMAKKSGYFKGEIIADDSKFQLVHLIYP